MKLSGFHNKLAQSADPQMFQSTLSQKGAGGVPDNGISLFGKKAADYDKLLAKLEETENTLV